MELIALIFNGKFLLGFIIGLATAIILEPLIKASLAKLFKKNG